MSNLSLTLVSAILFLWIICACAPHTCAVPAWGGAPGRSSIGNLVPGTTVIEAILPSRRRGPKQEEDTQHLSMPAPDHLGNLTAVPTSHSTAPPPLFFINQDTLWLYRNESAIYPINLVNATGYFPERHHQQTPLQLIADTKNNGMKGGRWTWRGTRLQNHHGNRNNAGVYYLCPFEGGAEGLFLFLKIQGKPEGCTVVTLHSFNRVNEDGEWGVPPSK